MDLVSDIASLIIGGLAITSCGISTSKTSTSSFKIRMQGDYTVATSATGDNAPQSQTFELQGIKLTPSDGTTAVTLDTGSPTKFKIIDRPQIIYSNTDMSSHDSTVFSKATVTFNTNVTVTTRTASTKAITLTSADLVLSTAFTITKAKAEILTIKVDWGDTVTTGTDGTETVQVPSFTLSFGDD